MVSGRPRGIGTTGWRLIAVAIAALVTAAGTAALRVGAPETLWVTLFVLAAAAGSAVGVLTVREQTEPRREQERGIRAGLAGHFLALARGVARAGERGEYFSGRTVAREVFVRWLTQPDVHGGVCVVTGAPGSGKSAVIGRLVAQSDPRLRCDLDLRRDPPGTLLAERTIDAVVLARGLTLNEVADTIAIQVDAVGTAPEQLAGQYRARPRVIVVDALNEASGEGEARRIAQRLLRPLAQAGARVLVGTRRGLHDELLTALGASRLVIDLDDERYLELDDLVVYVQRLLLREDDPDARSPYRGQVRLAQRVARAVAEQASPSFLVARLVGKSLSEATDVVDIRQRGWEQGFSANVGDAMEDYLDRFESDFEWRRARELLIALACAEGGGLPCDAGEDLWTVVAGALHDCDFSRSDIRRLLETAAADLIDVARGEPVCYRLFHRALADHLRPAAEEEAALAERRIARALRAAVTGGWSNAPAYVREHLATHAARGGCLDELLEDADYLLAAEPTRLLRALPSATAPQVARVRHVYRYAAANLRSSERAERAAYLELAARQAGDAVVADRFAELERKRPWVTPWAAWCSGSEHYVLGRHDGVVLSVAVGELDGRPIAISASADATLRVWDLQTATQHGEPLTGHNDRVMAVAVGELDGRPIAVSASADATLRVWDLQTATQHSEPLTGHNDRVLAVVVGELDGRPIAISGGDDCTLRVWDLQTATQHSEPLTGHNDRVWAVVVGEVEGYPIAISGDAEATLRVWDLQAGTQHGEPLTGHNDWVAAVAVGELDGRPIAISASADATLRVWDLQTATQHGQPLSGHDNAVSAVAVGELDGRPIAVSADYDETLRVWDLHMARQIRTILVGAQIAALTLDSNGGVLVGARVGVLCLLLRHPMSASAHERRTTRS